MNQKDSASKRPKTKVSSTNPTSATSEYPKDCNECDYVAKGPKQYANHQRSHKRTLLLQFTNQMVALTRDDNDNFICQCDAHPSGSKAYGTTHGIEQHVKQTNSAWLAPIPPLPKNTPSAEPVPVQEELLIEESAAVTDATSNEAVAPSGSDNPTEDIPTEPAFENEGILVLGESLINVPFLASFGLYFETKNKILCCLSCEMAFDTNAALTHVKSIHSDVPIRASSLQQFQQACDDLGALRELKHPAATVPAIPGLRAISTVFECHVGNCKDLRSGVDSMKQHHRKFHHGHQLPARWNTTWAQRFNSNKNNRWFKVFVPRELPAEPANRLNWITKAMEAVDERVAPPQISPDDIRELSPWLRGTKWPSRIKGHNPTFLRELVQLPKANEFPYLGSAVDAMYESAYSYVPITPLLVLQKLNSSDPVKGINNRPFDETQHDETLHGYQLHVVRLIAFLLRDRRNFPLALDSQTQSMVENVRETGESGNLESCSQAIHKLLSHTWTKRWDILPGQGFGDPTVCYIALSTINKSGTWDDPKEVTGTLAKFTRCIRATMLKEMHERGADGAASESNGEKVRENSETLSQWFTEKVESTFNDVRSLQHLASSLSYSSHGQVSETWWPDNGDGSLMLYRGNRIHLKHFKLMVRNMIQDAYAAFTEHVLMGFDLRIDYDYIYDDMSRRDPNYTFLSDPRNEQFQDRTILARKIVRNAELSKQFIKGWGASGDPLWDYNRLREWLHRYSQFHLALMAAVEYAGGSPSRGTEITSIQYRSTATRPLRGLYVMYKDVAVLCQYNKTTGLTLRERLIPHSLDALTADLVIQDLAIARPFAELASSIVFPGDVDALQLFHNYLFVDMNRRFTTTSLSTYLKKATAALFAEEYGVMHMRQITIGFRRRHAREIEALIENEASLETYAALQAGHSRQVENRIYAVSAEGRLTGTDMLAEFLKSSRKWHRTLELYPGGEFVSYRLIRNRIWNPSAMKEEYSSPLLPPKPKPPVAGYPSSLPPSSLPTPSSPDLFAPAKKDGIARHVRLSLASDFLPSLTCSLSLSPQRTPAKESKGEQNYDDFQGNYDFDFLDEYDLWDEVLAQAPHQSPPLPQSPILLPSERLPHSVPFDEAKCFKVMQRILRTDEPVQWKSNEQRECVRLAMERFNDMLCVLPTGGGKTSIWLVPAMQEEGCTTVVIHPLRALQDQQAEKLARLLVPFQTIHADTKSLDRHTTVILATSEVAATERFKNLLSSYNVHHRINRFVYDEAHMALTSDDYRPAMKSVNLLRSLPVPVILLSGTVPPPSQNKLMERFALHPHAQVIRACTNRPELRLLLAKPSTSLNHLTRRIEKAVETMSLHLETDDRGIIYAPSYSVGDHLSRTLNVPFYSSRGDLSDSDKQELLCSWLNLGQPKFIIATEALGAGFDFPSIRTVIHAGDPLEMITYVQQIGRAGRDGSVGHCILVPFATCSPPTPPAGEDHGGFASVRLYLQRYHACLRAFITDFSDGLPITCDDDPANIRCMSCADKNGGKLPEARGDDGQGGPNDKKPHPGPNHPGPWFGGPGSSAGGFTKSSAGSFRSFQAPSSNLGTRSANSAAPASEETSSSLRSTSPIELFSPPSSLTQISSFTSSSSSSSGIKRGLPLDSGFHRAASEVKRLRLTTSASSTDYKSRCLQVINFLRSGCPSCAVFGSPSCDRESYRCPIFKTHINDFRNKWRPLIVWNREVHRHMCWFCYIPQIDGLHPNVSRPADCLVPDKSGPFLFSIYFHMKCRLAAETYFTTTWASAEAFSRWLCAPPAPNMHNNAIELMLWYTEVYMSSYNS